MSEQKILYPVKHVPGGNEPDYCFFCPGCGCAHGVWTTKRNGITQGIWGFNGNMDKPTFTPSILVEWVDYKSEEDGTPIEGTRNPIRCHSFVRDGMIQFCGDTTHSLKGQTVPLPLF